MHDFCVIGGGIVGLSVANRLQKTFPGCDLVLIEKESQIARHQTGHNSGVIHSGIYYVPGSLKARLCQQGASEVKVFCEEHQIPVENCGKMLVATDTREIERMRALAIRAKQNQVEFDVLDAPELSRREPNISGQGALFVPATGIVDYVAICETLAASIRKSDGKLMLGTKVTGIEETGNGVEIRHASGTHQARQLIVCAGIQADRMVRLSGAEPEFRMVPFRGEYYRLPEHRNDIVSSLIYPIPDPDLPFLGIHLTRMIDGGVTVGPNAVLGMAREKYPKFSINFADMVDYLSYSGFWKIMKTHTRSGITEFKNSIFKSGYLEACRKYCPTLTLDDLLPEEAGIRAQAVMKDGSFAHDFLFHQTERIIHVCNAPSPAATSSFPISAMIAKKVEEQRRQLN